MINSMENTAFLSEFNYKVLQFIWSNRANNFNVYYENKHDKTFLVLINLE